MELSILAFEIPTGVVADIVSRKWSVIISFLVVGGAMSGLTTIALKGPTSDSSEATTAPGSSRLSTIDCHTFFCDSVAIAGVIGFSRLMGRH